MLDEKSLTLDLELKGREDLILKLQEGLNSQIQRTEMLNGKLLVYFEKDEKLKDLALVFEDEQRRMEELLAEQEILEFRNQRTLK